MLLKDNLTALGVGLWALGNEVRGFGLWALGSGLHKLSNVNIILVEAHSSLPTAHSS